jgi:hypothetical protein
MKYKNIMENKIDKIVYFAGAVRGDRVMIDTIKEIVAYIKEIGFPVLTEHVGTDDPNTILAGKIGKTKETLTAEDIEKQDIMWLDQATHIIAEISGASTGAGREIEYARMKSNFGKMPAKILCLYQIEREFYASAMIRGMDNNRYPNVIVESYKNTIEAKEIIQKFLQA